MDPDAAEKETARALARYEAILRRAEEEHVAYIVRESAIESERTQLALQGEPFTHLVQEVSLEGEYPKTVVKIRVWERTRNLEHEHRYPIWDEGMWTSPSGSRYPPDRLAGDMLLWARGG